MIFMNTKRVLCAIRDEEEIDVEDRFRNPYRILTEKNGEKNAYIFSLPIKSYEDNEIVHCGFRENTNEYSIRGVNAEITRHGKKITLENYMDRAEIILGKDCDVRPSTNGVLISGKGVIDVRLKTEYPYPIRENGISFSLMAEKHLPFLSVLPFFGSGKNGELIHGKISATALKDRSYDIRIFTDEECENITAEIQLYLPKLIFDTTVESRFPKRNNVYGSCALLSEENKNRDGIKEVSRLDPGTERIIFRINCTDNAFKGLGNIKKADLYIPKFSKETSEIRGYKITESWCTFNTDWSSLPEVTEEYCTFKDIGNYITADITELITGSNKFGLMLTNTENAASVAISTADSYEYPSIIKIKYE